MWCITAVTRFFTPSFSTLVTSARRLVLALAQHTTLSQSLVASRASLMSDTSPLISSTVGGKFSRTSSEMDWTMARTV